jgi:protein-S-isoprenylcysteine O-methyltransferase Ste14
MISESAFRLVLAVFVVIDLSVPAYFRRRAGASSCWAAQLKRGGLFVPERLLTFVLYCGLLAYIISPRWMAWSQTHLPGGIRVLGVLLAGLALAWMVWAFRHLRSNLFGPRAGLHTLVTTGPYRWIRHPLYSGWAALLAGYSLLTANWFVALVWLAALTAVVRRTPSEEAHLLQQFGEAYRDYAARTGRFLPRLRR